MRWSRITVGKATPIPSPLSFPIAPHRPPTERTKSAGSSRSLAVRNPSELATRSKTANPPRKRRASAIAAEGSGIAAAITALCIVGFVGARMLMLHDQPPSARLDGSTLTVLNAEGKELWRKAFPDGFWAGGLQLPQFACLLVLLILASGVASCNGGRAAIPDVRPEPPASRCPLLPPGPDPATPPLLRSPYMD